MTSIPDATGAGSGEAEQVSARVGAGAVSGILSIRWPGAVQTGTTTGRSTVTLAARGATTMLDETAATPAPALTDRCLDQLIQRRQRRRRQARQRQGLPRAA